MDAGSTPAGSTRNGQMTRKILSLLAILYSLIYFFYESWYHFNFGQSVLNLSIDYLAIILLLVAGIVNLKAKQRRGASMRSLGLYRMPHDESLCLEARHGQLRNRRIQGHVLTHLRDCRIDCCICFFVDSVIFRVPRNEGDQGHARWIGPWFKMSLAQNVNLPWELPHGVMFPVGSTSKQLFSDQLEGCLIGLAQDGQIVHP